MMTRGVEEEAGAGAGAMEGAGAVAEAGTGAIEGAGEIEQELWQRCCAHV